MRIYKTNFILIRGTARKSTRVFFDESFIRLVTSTLEIIKMLQVNLVFVMF